MTDNEKFTKQERITYGAMAATCIIVVAAFAFGVDLIPLLTAAAGLFAGINLPSPFDTTKQEPEEVS